MSVAESAQRTGLQAVGIAAAAALVGLVAAAAGGSRPTRRTDTCLVALGRCESSTSAGWLYQTFSQRPLKVSKGDALAYEVFLPADAETTAGHVDVDVRGENWKSSLRALKVDGKNITDQNGRAAGGVGEPARGQWYARRIPLDALAGKQIAGWQIGMSARKAGLRLMVSDNVRVHRADGTTITLYDDGLAPPAGIASIERFDRRTAALISVPRSVFKKGAAANELLPVVTPLRDHHAKGEGLAVEVHALAGWLGGTRNEELKALVDKMLAAADEGFHHPQADEKACQAALKTLEDRCAELALAPARVQADALAKRAAGKWNLKVDLAREIGPATFRASGFLHGMSKDEPPDELIRPLKPRLFRDRLTWRKGTCGVLGVHERVKALGATHMWVVSDSHGYGRSRTRRWLPGEKGDFSRWEEIVEDAVKQILAAGCEVQYDIWNEPSIGMFWKPGIKTPEGLNRWLKTWEVAFKKIRELAPKATIVGPSNGGYDPKFFKAFLEYAKANDCVPDIFSWHHMGLDLGFERKAEAARALMKQVLGKELPISINEFAGPSFQVSPGALVQFFAVFERAKIASANKSCWGDPDGQNCNNVSLNGLLTKPENRPRSVWWAYKCYADVTGTLVDVQRRGAIHGVAGHDADAKRARTVLGLFHGGGSGPHVVRFEGLEKTPWLVAGDKVRVKASWLPDTAFKPLDRPIVTVDGGYPTDGKTLSVGLPYVGNRDAYTVELSAPPDGKDSR